MAQNLNVGMKCVKYMLFVSNFMFVMVGVLLICFGCTIKTIYHDFELFMEDHYFSPAKLTIAIGIIILLISVFGCAAAIKESTCMVNMFAVLLSLALVLEVAASISAYAMRANLEFYMQDKMADVMRNYTQDNEAREAVDFLQTKMACCGVHVSHEWFMYIKNNTDYPESCCNHRTTQNPDERNCVPYASGCLDRLSYVMAESSVMLGSGALCIAFVQILGIAFAVMLAKSIRRLKTEQEAQRWQSRQELYLQLARGSDKTATTPVTYTATSSTTDA